MGKKHPFLSFYIQCHIWNLLKYCQLYFYFYDDVHGDNLLFKLQVIQMVFNCF